MAKRTLAEALLDARREVLAVQNYMSDLRGRTLAGSLGAMAFVDNYTQLISSRTFLASIETVAGIQAYAQDQLNDNTFAIGARFTEVQNAITSTISWITTNYPVSTDGYLKTHQIDGTTNPTERQFATAATAGFRTQADILITATNNFLPV